MALKGTFTHYRTCNLCEAMCGLEIQMKNGQIASIKGDKKDPFSQGYICPKATALQDLYEDPDRLKKPIKKTENGWKEISWKEAFDLVENGIKKTQAKYGRDAVGIYQGNPNVHNLGSMLFGSFFTRALKTKNRFSATSVDQLPHHVAAQFMLGHLLMMPIPDLNRTDFFLVFGANPLASNGSIMSTGGAAPRIKALQARGGKMVVIDPRKSETAQKADQHFFVKPGTDVFLLASFVHVLLKENLVKDLPDYVKGLKDIQQLFDDFSPAKTQVITGIKSDDLVALARDFVSAKSAVCYGRMGVSVQQYGVVCHWLINLINILTGNFDRPGGAMFPNPAFDVVMRSPKGTFDKFNRWQSRVRGLPEFGGELPVSVLAEEILTEGDGQIKAMVTTAGNPVLSTPNGGQLEKAFEQLDFMVSIDIYLNETTKHADVILPPTSGLENEHYDIVFHALAIHDHAKYSPPLMPASKGSKKDWQILKELTKRLKKKSSMIEKIMDPFFTPNAMMAQVLKKGPYKLSWKKLKKEKHGVDLGPLKPSLPKRLFTPDKKLDLAPELIVGEFKKLKEKLNDWDNDKMVLIGRRHLRSNNSWMHNSERLVKGPERCTVLIHPKDATAKSIQDQQIVEVESRVGKVSLPAEISEEMMEGVISIPHGWGHHRKGTNWKIAEAHAGVSVNDLTDDQFVDQFSGNAAFSGVPVEIRAIKEELVDA